jgi:hypothetical protein
MFLIPHQTMADRESSLQVGDAFSGVEDFYPTQTERTVRSRFEFHLEHCCLELLHFSSQPAFLRLQFAHETWVYELGKLANRRRRVTL